MAALISPSITISNSEASLNASWTWRKITTENKSATMESTSIRSHWAWRPRGEAMVLPVTLQPNTHRQLPSQQSSPTRSNTGYQVFLTLVLTALINSSHHTSSPSTHRLRNSNPWQNIVALPHISTGTPGSAAMRRELAAWELVHTSTEPQKFQPAQIFILRYKWGQVELFRSKDAKEILV